MTKGFYEKELIKLIEDRGYYHQSTIDALKVLATNGFDKERAAQYVLSKLVNGRNPMDLIDLYIAFTKYKKNS